MAISRQATLKKLEEKRAKRKKEEEVIKAAEVEQAKKAREQKLFNDLIDSLSDNPGAVINLLRADREARCEGMKPLKQDDLQATADALKAFFIERISEGKFSRKNLVKFLAMVLYFDTEMSEKNKLLHGDTTWSKFFFSPLFLNDIVNKLLLNVDEAKKEEFEKAFKKEFEKELIKDVFEEMPGDFKTKVGENLGVRSFEDFSVALTDLFEKQLFLDHKRDRWYGVWTISLDSAPQGEIKNFEDFMKTSIPKLKETYPSLDDHDIATLQDESGAPFLDASGCKRVKKAALAHYYPNDAKKAAAKEAAEKEAGKEVVAEQQNEKQAGKEAVSEKQNEKQAEKEVVAEQQNEKQTGKEVVAEQQNEKQAEKKAVAEQQNEKQENTSSDLSANLTLNFFINAVRNSAVGKFAKAHPVPAAIIGITAVVVITLVVLGVTHGAVAVPLAFMAAKAIKGAGVTAGVAIKGSSVKAGMAIASHGPASVGGTDTLMSLGIFAAGAKAFRKRFFSDAAPIDKIDKVEPILNK